VHRVISVLHCVVATGGSICHVSRIKEAQSVDTLVIHFNSRTLRILILARPRVVDPEGILNLGKFREWCWQCMLGTNLAFRLGHFGLYIVD
jgi:hypothetical protein